STQLPPSPSSMTRVGRRESSRSLTGEQGKRTPNVPLHAPARSRDPSREIISFTCGSAFRVTFVEPRQVATNGLLVDGMTDIVEIVCVGGQLAFGLHTVEQVSRG